MHDDIDAGRPPPSEPDPPVDRSYHGQRVLDLAVVFLLAVPVLVVGAVCAMAVAVTSRGPVLFRQTRVGHRGELFVILKFRTMIDNQRGNSLVPDDTQVTAVGRFLRRTSLDEVPQLVNVMRGEMSLVGPRPTLTYQVERYDERQRMRLAVRPGLTGLAQIAGRNSLSWTERIEWDLDYIERASVGLDLRIILRTLPAILMGTGVGGHLEDDPLSAPRSRGDRA